MRICLINPPRIHPKSWGKPSVFQPIEIAYVAAVLESEHDVCILDAAGEGWENIEDIDTARYRVGLKNEEIARRIKCWSPDVVGINVPFSGWSRMAFEVASIVKSIDKDITTVLDGVHPSARPLSCLENPNVDYVIIGEAEETWAELANLIERGANAQALKSIRGIGFRSGDDKIITKPRPLIKDLDSLPFPARHLLPMKAYFEAVKRNPLRGEVSKPWTMLITSRGCPYNCVFCTAHLVRGRVWRGRSPENVVEELEYLVDKYSVKQIDIHDDNMTLDRERVAKICDLIVQRDLDIEWFLPNGVRADTLDEDLLRKMRRSGCKRIYVAPESGVQRVVNEVIKKNLDLRKVEEVVALCRKIGIKVSCFFVIGLIGEKRQDIEATIRFAYRLRQLGADKFYFSYAMPLYGTELYNQAISSGLLKKDFSDDDLSAVQPIIETKEFTAEDLQRFCQKAYAINAASTLEKFKRIISNPRVALDTLYNEIRKFWKQESNVQARNI
ncbi:MAG: radical SAM protein [Candidatus Bathyarchaeia archaeon]